MFSWTADAALLVKSLVTERGWPDEAGLRLTTDPQHQCLTMTLAAGPRPGDEVLTRHNTRVFLHPTAAARLAAETLDADGNAAQRRFFLTDGTRPAAPRRDGR